MRKINWTTVFTLASGLVMSYLFPFVLYTSNAIVVFDHVRLILAGLAFGMSMLGFLRFMEPFGQSFSWPKVILTILGACSGFVIFFLAIIVMLSALIFPNFSTFPEVAARLDLTYKIFLPIFAYYASCLLVLWNKYEVRDGTFVILEGRVLYPKEKFTMYPWFRYDAEVMQGKVNISFCNLALGCRDGEFRVNIYTTATFDIEGAKVLDTRNLNITGSLLAWSARNFIEDIVLTNAQTMTLGEFLTKNHQSVVTHINDVPVVWDGKMKVSLA